MISRGKIIISLGIPSNSLKPPDTPSKIQQKIKIYHDKPSGAPRGLDDRGTGTHENKNSFQIPSEDLFNFLEW